MAAKTHQKKCKVYLDSAGGTSYTQYGDLRAIMMPDKTRGTADSTVMESTDDYREIIPGWKEGGEPTLRFAFHKTQYALLDAIFEADTIARYQFKFPLLTGETNNSLFTFLAVITKLGHPEKSTEGDEIWETELTLKISGKPTFTAGT